MTEPRCAICRQTLSPRGHYIHAAAMPDAVAAMSPEEREKRCRGDGDLVLLDGGARGFVRAALDLPMRHESGEAAIALVVWVELTKGAWRSLRSVEKPGSSAEVAGILASRIPGIDAAFGEHVRVRQRAEEPRARIVAAGKGKLARLERPGTLDPQERARIENAIAGEVASAIVEGFLAEKVGAASARWRDDDDGELACMKIDGAPITYATTGASAYALGEPAAPARVELVLQTRTSADDVVPPLLLALVRRAREQDAALVPGLRLELPGVPVLSAETGARDRAFVWLAPSTIGDLRGGPLALGPAHVHFVRVVPLHADEDALLASAGADALARRLDTSGLDPCDLARPSAVGR